MTERIRCVSCGHGHAFACRSITRGNRCSCAAPVTKEEADPRWRAKQRVEIRDDLPTRRSVGRASIPLVAFLAAMGSMPDRYHR